MATETLELLFELIQFLELLLNNPFDLSQQYFLQR